MTRNRTYSPEAKARRAEQARAYRKAHPEKHREQEKRRYWKKKAENPDKLRETARVYAANWRAANPERAKQVNQDYVKNNPEKVKATLRKYRYGITKELWDEWFTSQGNRCAICKMGDPDVRGWCLDHNHETREIRGILCHDCNTAIGFMRDSAERLQAAADYILSDRKVKLFSTGTM